MPFSVSPLIDLNEWFWNGAETMFEGLIHSGSFDFLWNDGNSDRSNQVHTFG
jgi:hypothetical protein